jgi:hypothetical protein
MLLDFGMPAVDAAGLDAGVLDRVLVDGDRRAVTHLVLRTPVASEDVLVPMDLVEGTADGRLRLRPGRDGLRSLPRYYEGRTSEPPRGRVDTSLVPEGPEDRQALDDALAIGDDTIELGDDTSVSTSDDVESRLAGVGTDDASNHIAVLHLRGPGGDAVIPEATVSFLREDLVSLRATRDDLLRSVPAARTPPRAPPPLEGLSGMGGRGGETREEAFGEDFVAELRELESAAAHAPATSHPGETGGRPAGAQRARRGPARPGG